MKKDRFKVITSGKVDVLEMTDEIREKMELEKKESKGEKMLEVEKMEAKGKELVAKNEKIREEIKKIDEQMQQLGAYRQQIVNKLLENNGAIKLLNDFLTPIKEKNKETIAAEIKKEEKKEINKDKKGVK